MNAKTKDKRNNKIRREHEHEYVYHLVTGMDYYKSDFCYVVDNTYLRETDKVECTLKNANTDDVLLLTMIPEESEYRNGPNPLYVIDVEVLDEDDKKTISKIMRKLQDKQIVKWGDDAD